VGDGVGARGPHPICRRCWERRNPGRISHRDDGGPQNERCHLCWRPTTAGIYVWCEDLWTPEES
jgi:hypothetical protein